LRQGLPQGPVASQGHRRDQENDGGEKGLNTDSAIVAEIRSKLDAICSVEGVVIPLAIESGSRAWGFPSPDSDYDCRFIYLRPLKENIALFPPRDVVELPLAGVFDVNGWDLRKAVKLLLKGNAVVIEWLQSPIAYRDDANFRSELLALARDVVDRSMVINHYYHLLGSTMRRHFAREGSPSLKKIFYALRPALALRQMRIRPSIVFPAMTIQDIMAQCELPVSLSNLIAALVEKKAQTREMGREPAPPELVAFIRDEQERCTLDRIVAPAGRIQRAEQAFLLIQQRWHGSFQNISVA
jgi:predicted nucleotidyltransferase